MTLKQQLTDDMKTAMKAGDKDTLGVVRLINAAIKQREVDERVELDDAAVLAVLEKMVKQRKDSVSQFEAANREDLAAIERAELAVIDTYLPAKLGEAEILAAIDAAVAETGASGPADMGKLMGVLKPRLAGQAELVVTAQVDGSLPEGFAAAGGVVAYEPVWAIGTGRTPTEADIAAIHAAIRSGLRTRFGAPGEGLRILYGGSVKPGNAAAILALPDVDGALVGGASLVAEDFLAIAAAAV